MKNMKNEVAVGNKTVEIKVIKTPIQIGENVSCTADIAELAVLLNLSSRQMLKLLNKNLIKGVYWSKDANEDRSRIEAYMNEFEVCGFTTYTTSAVGNKVVEVKAIKTPIQIGENVSCTADIAELAVLLNLSSRQMLKLLNKNLIKGVYWSKEANEDRSRIEAYMNEFEVYGFTTYTTGL